MKRIVLSPLFLIAAMMACGGSGAPVGAQSQEVDFRLCRDTFTDPADPNVTVNVPGVHPRGSTVCAPNGDQLLCDQQSTWQYVPIDCNGQVGLVFNSCGKSTWCAPPPTCPCGGEIPHCDDCCPPEGCAPDTNN
jgi:hypothetical protein